MGIAIFTTTFLAMCISFGLWQGSVWAGVFGLSLVVALLYGGISALAFGLEVVRLAARSGDPDWKDDA